MTGKISIVSHARGVRICLSVSVRVGIKNSAPKHRKTIVAK